MIWMTLFSLIATATISHGLQSTINRDFTNALGNNDCTDVIVSQHIVEDILYTNGFTICKNNHIVTTRSFRTVMPKSSSMPSPVITPVPVITRAVMKWPFGDDDDQHSTKSRQSPIDIITSLATDIRLPKLQLVDHLDEDVDSIIKNTGHTITVYVSCKSDEIPYVVGGPLKDKYNFVQWHAHWGTTDFYGSEHLINGESYSIEEHSVYYNSKYESYEAAKDKPDGLCVVTCFAEVANESNPLLEPLIRVLPQVSLPGQEITLPARDSLAWFTSAYCENIMYYAYPGSLTTEPFTENVIFIVFPTPVTISSEQLAKFRELYDDHNHHIEYNNRQVHPLNHRPLLSVDNSENYHNCNTS